MKTKTSKLLEVIIESINYIILCYALSNVAVLLKSNPIFILFLLLKCGLRETIGERYWS